MDAAGGLSPPPENELIGRRVHDGLAVAGHVAGFTGFDTANKIAWNQIFDQVLIESGQVAPTLGNVDAGVIYSPTIYVQDGLSPGRTRRTSFYDCYVSCSKQGQADFHRKLVFTNRLPAGTYIPLPLHQEIWTDRSGNPGCANVQFMEFNKNDFAFCTPMLADPLAKNIHIMRAFCTTKARQIFGTNAYDCGTSVILSRLASGPASIAPEEVRREGVEETVLRRHMEVNTFAGAALPNVVPVLVQDWSVHPAFKALSDHVDAFDVHPAYNELTRNVKHAPLLCLLTIRGVVANEEVLMDSPLDVGEKFNPRIGAFRRACCARAHRLFIGGGTGRKSVWDLIVEDLITSACRRVECIPSVEQVARAILKQSDFSDVIVTSLLPQIPHNTSIPEYFADQIRKIVLGKHEERTISRILESAHNYASEYIENCISAMDAFRADTTARESITQSHRTIRDLSQQLAVMQAHIERLERRGGGGAGAGAGAGVAVGVGGGVGGGPATDTPTAQPSKRRRPQTRPPQVQAQVQAQVQPQPQVQAQAPPQAPPYQENIFAGDSMCPRSMLNFSSF
jgi:hypothetical protein